jgi:hypothetical protein
VDFGGEVGGMGVEVGERRGLMGDGVINDELDFVNEEGFVVGGFVVLDEFLFMSVKFLIITELTGLDISKEVPHRCKRQ